MQADSSVEAPANISEAKEEHHSEAHSSHVTKHTKVDGMDAVGIIYGNVGTTEFYFRVFGDIETMEYVEVEHQHEGWVLGRVTSMERKTDLSLEKAKKIEDGEDVPIDEIVIGRVDVVGFRDDRGLLQVPRTPFRAGDHVYKAKGNLIKDVIGLRENTDTGAYVGLLFGHDIRVEIDINAMVQKHVSILAKTGGGKSFLCGDLIEELMKHEVTTMVFDPHGEYGAMREKGPSMKSSRNFGVTTRGYSDQIHEYATDTTINPKAKPLKFTLSNLDARDVLSLTSIKNGKAYLTSLRKAIESVKAAKADYALKDLIRVLEADEEGENATLINELEYLDEVNLFAAQGTKLDDLIVKGKMTIINFKGTPPDIQELIVNRIASACFELRKLGKIPPMMLVVEEAHNYCPQIGLAASSKIFRTIASEGRKFGLGLTIISQRAAKIDKNVLSQCNTQMILKVTNPNDLKAISASLEGLSPGMEDEIQRLPIGVALIMGGNIQMPLFVEVRPRESKHGGESVEVVPSKRV
ncbi:MAG TPA: ATP-binding protein [Methanomassiliicoccales archaeon]|nr:ATP-binding protein [Methanomassiliicoccales archaeon]